MHVGEAYSGMQDILNDWEPPVFLTAALAVTAIIYVRGWFAIRRTQPEKFPATRLYSFLGGLSVIWLALASPMDGLADTLLSAHMMEHLLIMSVAPPLLLLGWPQVPMLRGLPLGFRRVVIGPLMRRAFLRKLGHWLVQPLVAWFLMNVVFLAWHIPSAYDFALENEYWHDVEHLCFFWSSMWFWWPLVRPWPRQGNGAGWMLLPYLVLADFVNTALSAFLAFVDKPVYPYYLERSSGFDITPLADQKLGAAAMWVLGSTLFLIPAMMITWRMMGFGEKKSPPSVHGRELPSSGRA